MRELTSANCEMADEYFFAKLFFWVIPVCTEASAEASTVAWKKTVKKKPTVKPVHAEQSYNCTKMELPGRELASLKLAQVSTATNNPPTLLRCILADK